MLHSLNIPLSVLNSLQQAQLPTFWERAACQNWMLILPLLALLIILIMIIAGYFNRNPWVWCTDCSIWCNLARIGLLLYVLLFALVLGRALSDLCRPDRGITWQIDSSGTARFQSLNLEFEQNPQIVAGAATGTCIGCHTYSPDSRQVAAVTGGYDGTLTLIDVDSGQTTDLLVHAPYVAWSPDGLTLVAAVNGNDLALVNTATGAITLLPGASDPNVVETMPTWSPDGVIAFVRAPAPAVNGFGLQVPTDIYTIPASGGEGAVPLPGASGNGFNYYPRYSPDGKWLAFTHHINKSTYADPMAELYVMATDGSTAPIRLAANDAADGTALTNVGNSWPMWSNDSAWLAFTSQRHDPASDVFITSINDQGQSGPAQVLDQANVAGVFDHGLVWVEPQPFLWWPWLRNLLVWLLPFIPIAILIYLLCRPEVVIIRPEVTPVEAAGPPVTFPNWDRTPIWTAEPALIIGVGGAGRDVLMHLKRNLLEAGKDVWADQVQLLLIDTDEQALQGADAAGVRLDPSEMILLGGSFTAVLKRSNLSSDPAYKGWVPLLLNTMSDLMASTSGGTRGQRGLGRISLIEDLRLEMESAGSQVLNGITKRIATIMAAAETLATQEQQISPERLQIIIVGSVAGGMGSSTLFDLAYLSRLLARAEGVNQISLQGHLILGMQVNTNTSDARTADLNSAASLREIERFQLAEARPFPMTYLQGAPSPLDTEVSSLLFDQFYVYSGDRSQKPLNNVPREEGIAPAIADAVTLWLDIASRRGGVHTWRTNVRAATSMTQFQTGHVHVSGIGIFQYRLPVRDIIYRMSIRYAEEVLDALLNGQVRREDILKSLGSPDDSLDKFAELFLLGEANVEGCPEVWHHMIGPQVYKPDVRKRVRPHTLDEETELWRQYLNNLLNVILNGGKGKDAAGRVGRLQIARDLLHTLVDDRGEGVLPRAADAKELEPYPALREIVTRAIEVTQQVRATLDQQMSLLTDTSQGGTRQLLQAQHRQWNGWRKKLVAIRVRKYLWQNADKAELADVWYDRYLRDQVGSGVGQFYWEQTATQEWRLVFYGIDEQIARTEDQGDQARALADRIMEVGRSLAAQAIYGANGINITDLLRGGVLHKDELDQTASVLLMESEVLLGYDKDQAESSQQGVIVSAGFHLTSERNGLLNAMAQLDADIDPERAYLLTTTDSYVLVTARLVDLVPLEAVRTIESAYNAYDLEYKSAQTRRNLLQRAVFAAEALALQAEVAMPDMLRVSSRRLHPIVVTGLADTDKALAYFMALIAGDVKRQRVNEHDRVFIRITEDQPIILVDGPERSDQLNRLVLGLLRFRQRVSSEQADAMRQKYLADRARLRAHWQQWFDQVRHRLLERDSDPYNERILNDFVAAATLLVYQQLEDDLAGGVGVS